MLSSQPCATVRAKRVRYPTMLSTMLWTQFLGVTLACKQNIQLCLARCAPMASCVTGKETHIPSCTVKDAAASVLCSPGSYCSSQPPYLQYTLGIADSDEPLYSLHYLSSLAVLSLGQYAVSLRFGIYTGSQLLIPCACQAVNEVPHSLLTCSPCLLS